MRSVLDHQQVISKLFGPPETITVSVPDALGLVCADNVMAPISLPGFDNSAMDGFAVRAVDVAEATPQNPITLPVTEDIPAGRIDKLSLAPQTAHRIMTGAPLPAGADAVIPVEATTTDDVPPGQPPTNVTVTAAVPPGRHLRHTGSDIRATEIGVHAGTVIGAPQIGLLAALGITEITVIRPVRVAVLSTGSELVAPGTPLQHGQIYESNGAMLTAAATEAGAHARHEHFVPDDTAQFLARIDQLAADADLIITSGGVSAGAFEVVKEALSTPRDGATPTVEFVKVAMQPGMPQGYGYVTAPGGRRVPIITLPGNPVSSLVSFEVFIRAPLRVAMGLPGNRPQVRARLVGDIRSPQGKRQFLRGELSGPGGEVVAIGPPASHHLRYLASANALIDVPAEVTEVASGQLVDVIEL